jgi:DNA invertase Pin-like site-specific DNA recombinase
MKIALYARVSTLDQHPENQKHQLVHFAEKEGYQYEFFEEKETTRKTRPVKNELYHRLLKKEFDGVAVVALTRWARSLTELVREVTILWDKGVKFISLKENIDLSSATGRLQFHMFCAFAEFERGIISERTKEAFYTDDNGVVRSIKNDRPIGKRGKDKARTKRSKTSYYQGWITRRKKKGALKNHDFEIDMTE